MSGVVQNLDGTNKLFNAFNASNAVSGTDTEKQDERKKYPSPISFRPTEDEREQLLRDANGMSQSAYIRQCLFGKKVSKRVVPDADRLLLAQILAKLGESRIANNLNQIAYHANSHQ